MPGPVPFRLLSKRDEENMQFLLSEYPHKGIAEALRHLLELNRIRHEDGNSKDQRMERLEEGQDAMREQLDCIQALLVMLLHERGMKPVESKKSIPVGEIPGCQRRDK